MRGPLVENRTHSIFTCCAGLVCVELNVVLVFVDVVLVDVCTIGPSTGLPECKKPYTPKT